MAVKSTWRRPVEKTHVEATVRSLPKHRELPGYALMLLVVVLAGIPIYWMVVAAFKETAEIYRLPVP
jgi:ABC-type glycerol-3-phosphate transport system permease component